jgi:hypothetical protein
VVLDESKHKGKLTTLLDFGVYVCLPKNPTAKVDRKEQKLLSKHKTALLTDLKHPTAKVERKEQKLLSKHKTALLTDLKHKLTPYHSKPSHLYSLPKIHKPDIPLRPTVSSIGSPCNALAGFLHKILNLLAGKSESFVKNSGHFVQLLKSVNLQSLDTFVSFDDVSLFTNVPVDEALQVIRNKRHNNDTWTCWKFGTVTQQIIKKKQNRHYCVNICFYLLLVASLQSICIHYVSV